MKKPDLCVVVTFYTTAAAMEWETACKAVGIPGKLISAPRALAADCGIAWQSPAVQKSSLETLALERDLEFDRMCEEAL